MAMRKIEGGCHCGAVRYEAEADLGATIACNCSHCQAKGFILAFTPAENFRLLRGEDRLTEYRFNEHKIDHRFCSVCGTQAFAWGPHPDMGAMAAINVRTIDGIDLDALAPHKHDGRSL